MRKTLVAALEGNLHYVERKLTRVSVVCKRDNTFNEHFAPREDLWQQKTGHYSELKADGKTDCSFLPDIFVVP